MPFKFGLAKKVSCRIIADSQEAIDFVTIKGTLFEHSTTWIIQALLPYLLKQSHIIKDANFKEHRYYENAAELVSYEFGLHRQLLVYDFQ